ncbi:hypothetical protein [Streptomyces sp. S.PNR 29]|uniref:hypothetical protein n=1 Tax=Streptomyces sp. S.PNR 29 TaxID=2973805 RepID=UPI0025B08855|nr:hypothetical protein [Streptomyces sp. S.PNR 29]MDN0199029.1 hypothetical protein [Streptomyces sp. S.PNR 29]
MTDTQLTVTLSGGGIEDAREVVRTLQGVFGEPDDLPANEHATVRTAVFTSPATVEASGSPQPGAVRLSAPVTVTVQGSPQAVAAASDTLAHAFRTRDEGVASGDQEQERQLLLVP